MVDKCYNTTFYIGPIKGSIFFRDCDDCNISVACSQFRCRDLNRTTINLFAANDPIIESSQDLTFAPYNFAYPLMDQHAASANLKTDVNKWNMIFDFTTKSDGTNFKVMDPSEWQMVKTPVDGMEEQPVVAFPYPEKYGGTISDSANFASSAEQNAFGIDMSQNQAS